MSLKFGNKFLIKLVQLINAAFNEEEKKKMLTKHSALYFLFLKKGCL